MHEEPIHEEQYHGLTIKILPDTDPLPPEGEGDGAQDYVFLVHYHRDFCFSRDAIITEDDVRDWYQGHTIEQSKHYWIFAVEAYIHGGVVLALSNEGNFPDRQWDVSHVGAMLVSKKWKRLYKSARKAAQVHIETWNDYLSGDVYGYVVENSGGDTLESCYGYYRDKTLRPDYQYCLAEARAVARAIAQNAHKKHAARVKAYIRQHVPFANREPFRI